MVSKNAPRGKEFRFYSGKKVSSIEEMQSYLKLCSSEEYAKHVTPKKNDFSTWISKVHEEHALASRVKRSKSQQETIAVLRTAINKHYASGAHLKQQHRKRRKRTKKPNPVWEVTSSDYGHFMTKEFVYGLIFGFILGLIMVGIWQVVG